MNKAYEKGHPEFDKKPSEERKEDGLTYDQIEVGKTYWHLNGEKVKVIGKNPGYIPIECYYMSSGGAFRCVPGYLIKEVIEENPKPLA